MRVSRRGASPRSSTGDAGSEMREIPRGPTSTTMSPHGMDCRHQRVACPDIAVRSDEAERRDLGPLRLELLGRDRELALGELVVRETLDDAPSAPTVGGDRESVLQTLGRAVLTA